MPRIFHLSDLHLATPAGPQAILFDRLVDALRRERAAAPEDRIAIAITGDLFDSASDPIDVLVEAFLRLYDRILDALGGDAPTIVVPGNHDRRRLGLFGPHREGLFRALHSAVDGRPIYVAGTHTPFLAQVVPPEMHGLPAHVVAYDSSYLARGFIGAGGTIRLEDLLQAHARLPDDGLPLVVLIHHHLIPTPVTDVSLVESDRTSRIARWFLGRALPALVANADREELTMTALGAGTALSTLQSFGRAVLLLHGHKHVPTARLVRAMSDGGGDVLLTSAGSAGHRQELPAARDPGAARLWPSFNVIDWTGDAVRVQSLSFAPKASVRRPVRRTLASARHHGPKWDAAPVSFRVDDVDSRIESDEASFVLTPAGDCWDFVCERRVRLKQGKSLRRYIDFMHVAPRTPGLERTRRRVQLAIGDVTRYDVPGGLVRTLDEARRRYGPGTAFEWVGLLCRYGARHARLHLARANAESLEPFASVTDLTIGRERPVALAADADGWTVTCEACQPRSLLRIYWPLPAPDRRA
jgi:3',5'-cyclic AMP phosphodiesterase CpdA